MAQQLLGFGPNRLDSMSSNPRFVIWIGVERFRASFPFLIPQGGGSPHVKSSWKPAPSLGQPERVLKGETTPGAAPPYGNGPHRAADVAVLACAFCEGTGKGRR